MLKYSHLKYKKILQCRQGDKQLFRWFYSDFFKLSDVSQLCSYEIYFMYGTSQESLLF